MSYEDLFQWQKNVVDNLLSNSSCNRKIWLYDDGNTGKTYLSNYMREVHNWMILPVTYNFPEDYEEAPGYIIHQEDPSNEECDTFVSLLKSNVNFLVIANSKPKANIDGFDIIHTSDV